MLICDIVDSFGSVESAATRDTVAECVAWYREHDISFDQVVSTEINGRVSYRYTRPEEV